MADRPSRQGVLAIYLIYLALLVGERGVGKTALVERLALRLASEDVPAVLRGKALLAVDGADLALLARHGTPSMMLDGVERLVERARDGALLFLNRLHVLAEAWEEASSALARLRLVLLRGEAQAIGEMAPDDYRRWTEADAVSGRFEPLMVAPPGQEETVAVLRMLKEDMEQHHDVSITEEALIVAAGMAADKGLPLPRGAIDLLDEAAGRAYVRGLERVTRELVSVTVEARGGSS